MTHSLAIFLHSGRYDRVYQAIAMLLTASSMGWRCHLFLFYDALDAFMAGTWDDINIDVAGDGAAATQLQDGFESAALPSLYEMLQKARDEMGGVKVCACSASCRIVGADVAQVRDKVDEVVGLATMMKITADTQHVLYI